jgi:adenylosuccinate lyase
MNPSKYDTYASPLAERNASAAMLRLWSPRHKFNTWRRIWLAVAEAMHEITRAHSASEGASAPRGTGVPPVRSADGSNTSATSTGGTPVPPSRELVTKEQVEELRAVVNRQNPDGTIGITDDEIRLAERYERDLRHDVMAHVHALGDACPKAKGIIHLGMTSQDVVCNADLLILERSVDLIREKLVRVIVSMAAVATRTAHIPALAFTHYQAAQPATVGRRLAQWAADLHLCHERIGGQSHVLYGHIKGLRGATGTQASFLKLLRNGSNVDLLEAFLVYSLTENFSAADAISLETSERILSHDIDERQRWVRGWAAMGDSDASKKCAQEAERLKNLTAERRRMHFADKLRRSRTLPLVTQTYPRVIDTFILADLASTAAVLHKIATDIRLLCNRKELDEPFEDKQIGSSAMPYKRNPMRCERICGLTRFVMNLVGNAYDTAATQWLERTLDDSSNRRLSLPEAFLALDGALDLMHNVASGLVVHEAMVRKNLMAELPFLASENVMMACVKLGGDRQHYHELIRVHAQAAGMRVKREGLDNDLLERLKSDKNFWSTQRGGPLREELDWDNLMDPMKYIGRSVEQTERFIEEVIEPLRERYAEAIAKIDESGPRV